MARASLATADAPVFLPVGEQAISVQFGEVIDPDINARVLALADALLADPPQGVLDVVPTYRALLIRYAPAQIRGAALEHEVRARLAQLVSASGQQRQWDVPVLYGGNVGQDLETLAADKGMSAERFAARHAGADYRVYMVGFAPGFAYLGGLPPELAAPRLATPRQRVPAGAIGIGGEQASINSVAGPSGWRYIGWTPVRLFDPQRNAPFLLAAGDRVRFVPVGVQEAAALEARAQAGDPLITPGTRA